MKKYMPLEGLRWSRDSGSALCDTSQNSRSRTGWGGQNSPIVCASFVTGIKCLCLQEKWLLETHFCKDAHKRVKERGCPRLLGSSWMDNLLGENENKI